MSQIHPAFASCPNHSLQLQVATLQCILAWLTITRVRAPQGVNNKLVREIKTRVDQRRAEFVEECEKLITFGSCRYWADVVEDGAALRKVAVAGTLGKGEGKSEDGLTWGMAR